MITLKEILASKEARRRGRRRALDVDAVEKIRDGYAHKNKSVAELATQFELSVPTVYKVVFGRGCYPFAKIAD